MTKAGASASLSSSTTARYSARVRQSLLAITGVLSLIALAFAGSEIAGAMKDNGNAQTITTVNETTDRLLSAAGNWAVERGLSVGALQAATAAAPETVARINERREKADAALAAALADLATVADFAGKEAQVAEVRRAHAVLVGARQEIDAALAQPGDRRDPGLAQRAGTAVTDVIMKSQQLRRATGRVATDLEGLVASLAQLKHFAWVVAEYAGRERAAIASLVNAKGALDAAMAQNLADYRGRLELGWSEVKSLANGATTPAAIKSAVAEAEHAYFVEFERTRQAVYKAATGGQPYPLSGQQWFAAATAGIDPLLKVGETAGTETKTYATANLDSASRGMMTMAVVLALVIAIAAFAFWLTTARVTRPLASMTRAMGALAGGDKAVEIPGVQRTDEIGEMAAAVKVFKENMIENERLQAEQREAERRAAEQEKAREEEKRAAEERAAAERRQAMLDLADSFEQTVGAVIQSVTASATQMEASAQSLSATAEETSRQSTSVAAAAEQATANVQTVATASEELSASIGEISRQVAESARIANNAVTEAQNTNERVRGLSQAAQKIGDVVALITDIASQTNLLALNATIEAARAGEAGKGFAVVASEVKTLANQTAKATDEIAGQIANIQTATREAVTAIEGIGKTIVDINEIAASIASAVEEQGAATKDIAINVQQAAQGTNDVSSNISGVMSAAEQTGAAATQVLGAARSVSTETASLGSAVNAFLDRVRAA